MSAALLLLSAVDPLALGVGIFMIVASITSFMQRRSVADRLARYYAQQRGPSWAPAIFRKRFGIRETRIISFVLPALGLAVGCQQIFVALM